MPSLDIVNNTRMKGEDLKNGLLLSDEKYTENTLHECGEVYCHIGW